MLVNRIGTQKLQRCHDQKSGRAYSHTNTITSGIVIKVKMKFSNIILDNILNLFKIYILSMEEEKIPESISVKEIIDQLEFENKTIKK